MRFIIKPNEPSFSLLLETNRYKNLWRANSRKIMRAFREVTGLEFQQRVITARVFQDNRNIAGVPGDPMHLSGNLRPDHEMLLILVHELAHRLVGGNALGPMALGISSDDTSDDELIEYNHRLIYLFLYDVVNLALGEQYATACKQFEEEPGPWSDSYPKAWQWAMSMNRVDRQQAMQRLATEAFPRERWHERDDGFVAPPLNPEAWFNYLRTGHKDSGHAPTVVKTSPKPLPKL